MVLYKWANGDRTRRTFEDYWIIRVMYLGGLFIPCFAQILHRNYFAILGVVLFFSWLASIIRLKKQRGFDGSTKREWTLSQKYCLPFQRRLNKYIPSFNTPLFLLCFLGWETILFVFDRKLLNVLSGNPLKVKSGKPYSTSH